MTSATRPEAPAVPPATPTLDDFFARVRSDNPFAVNRVGVASAGTEDAPDVHHRAYARLLELAERARQQRLGVGALMWGEAGIGKSHLLARLGRWAGRDHKQAVYVYLTNLQAQPEQLPRSLLRCVVSILTGGLTARFYRTPLFALLNAAIREALHDEGTRHFWRDAETAYRRLVDDLCGSSPGQAAVVDRQVYAVFFRFFRSAYQARGQSDDGVAALASRWLAGDSLDPDEAGRLGVAVGPQREPVSLADDEQVKRVLIALAQLASYRQQPLLVCLDQVDNLEPEQFAALARFLHALLDSAANLLVVTAGVRETIARWKEQGVIQASTWDRLAEHEIELQRVTVPEARQIVQARLQPFQEAFLSVGAVKELVQKDYLFPLGEAWAKEFLGSKIEVRPRDVITWAREGWRRQQEAIETQGGSAWLDRWEGATPPPAPPPKLTEEEIRALIDGKVDAKLREHLRQRLLEPQTLPPDADNLAGLLLTLLRRCPEGGCVPALVGVDRRPRPRRGQPSPYDLVLRQRPGPDGAETRTGVLCLVVSNRNSMAGFLRRLAEDDEPPERLVLVTDERRPLDPADRGREYLDQIRRRYRSRYRHVELSFDEYAELDALQAAVGLARSGDLEIELPGGAARRVGEDEVLESHRRRGRYLAHPLLRLLLTGDAAG
jgi:hypothetical protein